jgi:hypothetical protein
VTAVNRPERATSSGLNLAEKKEKIDNGINGFDNKSTYHNDNIAFRIIIFFSKNSNFPRFTAFPCKNFATKKNDVGGSP